MSGIRIYRGTNQALVETIARSVAFEQMPEFMAYKNRMRSQQMRFYSHTIMGIM